MEWGPRCPLPAPDGSIERIVEMPCPNPTSVAFGGPDLATLYVTSSRLTLSAEQLTQWPLSGSLFAITPGVRGLPEDKFLG